MPRSIVFFVVLFVSIGNVCRGAEEPAGQAASNTTDKRVILTPKPAAAPKINGPKVQGCRPGRPFLYRIPCTGNRPIIFGAETLPASMTLDAASGIISGRVPSERGEYAVTLSATNADGSDRRAIKVIVGDTLALTPPMGWNSWYIHYAAVTEANMRNAADVMVSSGMADYGYQYVNIDDCWMKKRGDEPYRDQQKAVLPNAKFPDIKGMVEHIHAKGLRAGLYTSPGPWTCTGYVGSHQHEEIDAKKFAEWGFDFLKYDWCSYGEIAPKPSRDDLQKPYLLMAGILKRSERDIVLNLCQYGMGNVWEWGGEVGGQCWRTTGDLGAEKDTRLPGFYTIALSNARHWKYPKPGQWNDPDYILIGWIGGPSPDQPVHVKLTDDEQYSYMSMWCLMASPLIFSGDMARLDPFTLNVLCNAEVIDVDQDPLGKQARILRQNDDELVLAKPMEDGSVAVGLLNLADSPRAMRVAWSDLELTGKRRVRDLWRQKDLGECSDEFTSDVNRHGVVLVRISP
ncbi:MAG: putative Ig domain-containing protein [Planctomycetia bacterium]|nr:putative Ig domain-containing protein [Planctomycetia bacterium]